MLWLALRQQRLDLMLFDTPQKASTQRKSKYEPVHKTLAKPAENATWLCTAAIVFYGQICYMVVMWFCSALGPCMQLYGYTVRQSAVVAGMHITTVKKKCTALC